MRGGAIGAGEYSDDSEQVKIVEQQLPKDFHMCEARNVSEVRIT